MLNWLLIFVPLTIGLEFFRPGSHAFIFLSACLAIVPLAAWLGATLGLMVKGGAAIFLGLRIRHYLPLRTLRIVASSSCCLLGIIAVAQTVFA